jgi:hypothetical protein
MIMKKFTRANSGDAPIALAEGEARKPSARRQPFRSQEGQSEGDGDVVANTAIESKAPATSDAIKNAIKAKKGTRTEAI